MLGLPIRRQTGRNSPDFGRRWADARDHRLVETKTDVENVIDDFYRKVTDWFI